MSEKTTILGNLSNLRESIVKHKLVEDLAHRQEMRRHDLVEDVANKQDLVGLRTEELPVFCLQRLRARGLPASTA